jgi:hypothetical protein
VPSQRLPMQFEISFRLVGAQLKLTIGKNNVICFKCPNRERIASVDNAALQMFE